MGSETVYGLSEMRANSFFFGRNFFNSFAATEQVRIDLLKYALRLKMRMASKENVTINESFHVQNLTQKRFFTFYHNCVCWSKYLKIYKIRRIRKMHASGDEHELGKKRKIKFNEKNHWVQKYPWYLFETIAMLIQFIFFFHI